mmetsp:Transcript_2108/g.6047  ORF Transcript_2108/g.6047 Transcript_2108/m.6047 type:complete len:204 (+) Transcript_2108:210-821(+)
MGRDHQARTPHRLAAAARRSRRRGGACHGGSALEHAAPAASRHRRGRLLLPLRDGDRDGCDRRRAAWRPRPQHFCRVRAARGHHRPSRVGAQVRARARRAHACGVGRAGPNRLGGAQEAMGGEARPAGRQGAAAAPPRLGGRGGARAARGGGRRGGGGGGAALAKALGVPGGGRRAARGGVGAVVGVGCLRRPQAAPHPGCAA